MKRIRLDHIHGLHPLYDQYDLTATLRAALEPHCTELTILRRCVDRLLLEQPPIVARLPAGTDPWVVTANPESYWLAAACLASSKRIPVIEEPDSPANAVTWTIVDRHYVTARYKTRFPRLAPAIEMVQSQEELARHLVLGSRSKSGFARAAGIDRANLRPAPLPTEGDGVGGEVVIHG